MRLGTLCVVIFLQTAATQQACYWPDQTEAKSFVSCNATAGGAQGNGVACCPQTNHDYCTVSGLCYGNGLVYRGACTDKTWTSPDCASQCTNVVKGNIANIFYCGAASHQYQCGTGHGKGDCQTSLFSLDPPVIVLRNDQQPGQSNAVGYSAPNASFVPASSVPSSTVSTVPSTAAPSCSAAPAPNHTDTTAVGLGVGLPLGALLLASWVFCFVMWKRLRNAQQDLRHSVRLDPDDLARAVGKVRSATQPRVAEMAAPWEAPVMQADRSLPVHELASPVDGRERRSGFSNFRSESGRRGMGSSVTGSGREPGSDGTLTGSHYSSSMHGRSRHGSNASTARSQHHEVREVEMTNMI